MASEREFAGKTAVITGAASGIGAGLARHAAQLGVNLVLADVQAEPLQRLAATLPGRHITVATDVSDADAVLQLAERAYETFEHVDLVFNNAGILLMGFLWEMDSAQFERQMTVNVRGVFNVIRAFIPRMIAAGNPSRMINTASIGGFIGCPLMASYAASKSAIVGLTESLHYEMQMLRTPVKISLLCPGPVKSEIFAKPLELQSQNALVTDFLSARRKEQELYGLSTDQCARVTFEGIAHGNYWLLPQPELLDSLVRMRTDLILRRAEPGLGELMAESPAANKRQAPHDSE